MLNIRTHERLLRASKRLNVLFEETENLYKKVNCLLIRTEKYDFYRLFNR